MLCRDPRKRSLNNAIARDEQQNIAVPATTIHDNTEPAKNIAHHGPSASAGMRLTTTFEVLEQILLETPVTTIRCAQRVNKTFCATISNSQRLQRKLYFLRNAIKCYGEVAEAVNQREMTRFANFIRERWDPDDMDEWDSRWGSEGCKGEGYTEEGGLAMCIWKLAFRDHEPERQGELCEAERRNQILLHPPIDAFVDEIPKPLADPAPDVEEKFEELRVRLQEQYDRNVVVVAAREAQPAKRQPSRHTMPAEISAWARWRSQQKDVVASLENLVANGRSDLVDQLRREKGYRESYIKTENQRLRLASPDPGDRGVVNGKLQLPIDFRELMRVTSGINGAGVPSETAGTKLVYPIDEHSKTFKDRDMLSDVAGRFSHYTVLAAWLIGDSDRCTQRFRVICYVFCYEDQKSIETASWKIWDNKGPGWDMTYENMAEFLGYERETVDETEGGAATLHILDSDSYAVDC
ncbi:hypothetical protein LTR15_003293 [Elasticomyces elasticus]|nr:hypothetical protein LTR15_003293 [Elasticomyces elasticus]